MKYPYTKAAKLLTLILCLNIYATFSACKKETAVLEVEIDAFADVNPVTQYREGIYTILFTLQQFPYQEVGLRVATDKTGFHKNRGLNSYQAYKVNANRYGVFLNTLERDEIYYYQIYVKDSHSSNPIFSDIYSFKTNP